ncbi:hypothetical protein I6F48_03705 [Pseudoalteromonas sp. SWYJ118]|uniref:hypothetical protein n=2 Tax=unclassified Pseudoalteromonas TaxID=194690 RepID=UPI0018CF9533|nr:hypothetical protein [Pseudoalteromonas sp. SWYJ118]MBH0074668.1 hypothetical protein [Pseudoalteromonas sp. SWYJ118]
MISWFSSIFSEKAQQAQLVTILISVAVAIFAVFLNQYYLSRRAQKEIYIKKAEEAFLLLPDLRFKMCAYIANLHVRKSKMGNNEHNELIGIMNKVETYFELYFTDNASSAKKIKENYLELRESILSKPSDDTINKGDITADIKSIEKELNELKDLIKSVIHINKHL